MKQLLRFSPLFFLCSFLTLTWRCFEALCPKLTIIGSFLIWNFHQAYQVPWKEHARWSSGPEKALGFIKDHSCLTRPVPPQCLSVPSVQRDSMPCGALDLFGGAGGVQWDMVWHGSCLFSLSASTWGKVCAGHGRRSVTARPDLEIEGS